LGSVLVGHPVAVPFVGETRLLMARGMTAATGNYYVGLLEFTEMAFVLHALRREDLFVDVGANVGVYTVLASGAVGCRTIAVEPIPGNFQHLLDNVSLNRLQDRVTALNVGAGTEAGTLRFSCDHDTTDHVLAAGEGAARSVDVPVRPLDELLGGQTPVVLKLDVEGFEYSVLSGGPRTLRSPGLQAVLVELNGQGARYGFRDEQIHDLLSGCGFTAHTYLPFERRLRALRAKGRTSDNVLYVRDPGWVQERLTEAPKVRVGGEGGPLI
jgi:FkbM family methyltransferase